ADDLAVEPDGVHDVHGLAVALRQELPALGDVLGRRLEGLPLDCVRGRVLLEGLDPPRREALSDRWRFAGQDERDCVPLLVSLDPALEQRVDESGRGGAADLPLRLRPSALPERRSNLGDHSIDLLEREALPLDGVPFLARAHAERVAAGVDPLVARPERGEGVRVLRNLTQHAQNLPLLQNRYASVTGSLGSGRRMAP